MSLRSLLATMLALLGVWHISKRLYVIPFVFLNWQNYGTFWHCLPHAFVFLVDLSLIAQRDRLAGLILGRSGNNWKLTDRGLMAVGCASIGACQFLPLFTQMCLSLESAGPIWAIHYGPHCVISVFFIGAARWVPLWVGWGRLDPGSIED